MTQPSGLKNLLRAAAGALPFVPRNDHLPSRKLTISDVPIDRGNVADYAAVTGLRYGDTVPLADNKTAAGKAQNRRVEFKLVTGN